MRHYLCWLAVLGVVAIPTAAAACWPMWGYSYQYPAPVYGTPMYAMPVYVAPRVMAPRFTAPLSAVPYYAYPPARPVVVLPPIPRPAVPSAPPAPPSVELVPNVATPTPAPAPAAHSDPPARKPAVEPVRPAAGSDAPPTKGSKAETPPPFPLDLKFPEIEIPKSLQANPKPPAKEPQGAPKAGTNQPDPAAVPKVPAVGGTKDPLLPAIPSAAPAPEPAIPPPGLPLLPDASKRDPLPSLTLPPDTPVKSAKTDSTSRSSPIAGSAAPRDLIVNVFPAGRNEAAAGGYRTVGFFNHTNRDLTLTIEGRVVKLPARSYLHAQLAATFTWGCAARPTARETVPDGADGLDVVFRE